MKNLGKTFSVIYTIILFLLFVVFLFRSSGYRKTTEKLRDELLNKQNCEKTEDEIKVEFNNIMKDLPFGYIPLENTN